MVHFFPKMIATYYILGVPVFTDMVCWQLFDEFLRMGSYRYRLIGGCSNAVCFALFSAPDLRVSVLKICLSAWVLLLLYCHFHFPTPCICLQLAGVCALLCLAAALGIFDVQVADGTLHMLFQVWRPPKIVMRVKCMSCVLVNRAPLVQAGRSLRVLEANPSI